MPKTIDLSGNNDPNLTISMQELQNLVNRYRDERYNKLVPAYIASDTRAVWLSKHAIDAFFQANAGFDGIRLYYGVIDDLNHVNGAHNLIIVATKKDASNTNVDKVSELDTVLVAETFALAVAGEPESGICPPPNDPCNGNSINYQ